jgi:hypothetical protein
MIFVKRSAVPAPVSLTAKDGLGAKELKRARSHITGPNSKKSFPFAAYKGGDVKTKLEALFHGK